MAFPRSMPTTGTRGEEINAWSTGVLEQDHSPYWSGFHTGSRRMTADPAIEIGIVETRNESKMQGNMLANRCFDLLKTASKAPSMLRRTDGRR